MSVRVVDRDQAIAREQAAISAGIPESALMRAAGEGAAESLLRNFPIVHSRGVQVYCGTGNNGGDGWVLAGHLAARGVAVKVVAIGDPKSSAAQAAERATQLLLAPQLPPASPAVIVDALLGTGARGEPTGAIAEAIRAIHRARALGARVVALDLPSGIDASTGAGGAPVTADLTCTFGTLKRGVLHRRDECGAIEVLDIGLGIHAELADGAPNLADETAVRVGVPPIPADAHKGVRRRLVILGGAEGMAGAVMMAARGALRSGIGVVQLSVAPAAVSVVQTAVPEAMAARWPLTEEEQHRLCEWAHVMLIGPGLGQGAKSRAMVERLLIAWRGPVVLDADALNVFEGEPRSLGTLLGGRPAVVTPHPLEAARLLRAAAPEILSDRYKASAELARLLGATVLLKGLPTLVTSTDGRAAVLARGTPALGTGGSGDLLGGIVATLLGQTLDPFTAAMSAGWIHGRAAEIASEGQSVRGTALVDVVDALRLAWRLDSPSEPNGVLARLPAVGGSR